MKNKIPLIIVALAFTAATVFAGDPIYVYDSDGNGSETLTLSGADSVDPDGAIIDFQWRVNGALVFTGFGPQVLNLTHTFSLGGSTVSLTVRDDVQVSSADVSLVTVLPQSANNPPVANATVPSSVMANALNVATITVNASASSDPEGDPIYRYVWTEGATTLYDGASPITAFQLNGLGQHTIRLKVFSRDGLNITQTGIRDFVVTLEAANGLLAGIRFSRAIGQDFPFAGETYGDFAGITYNALTQTYFVTENKLDKIFEINADGTLLRTIDIAGLKTPAEPETDAEGITWMYGTQYALVLEGGEEMAVVQISSTTTSLIRSQATIYDLSGDPKGVSYLASEDALYWVSEDGPMRVVKSKINRTTGNLDIVFSKDVTGLPASALGDIAFFPRISRYPLLISHSSRTIMEVDVAGATPVLKSSFSLTAWDIPEGSGLVFGADARMYVVGKHAANTPEDDYNIFVATFAIPNKPPVPQIEGVFGWYDQDGNGSEPVLVRGLSSNDVDGAIVRYEWYVNGSRVSEGFDPIVGDLNREFALGTSTVTLIVYDDAQTVAQKSVNINVFPASSNLPPVARAIVPPSAVADSNGLAFVMVDASDSSDPDNDPITRYVWSEGASVYYDGANPVSGLNVEGAGQHAIKLMVYSTDVNNVVQSSSAVFF